MKSVFLASSSPRRQELLAQLGVQFSVVVAQIDESIQAGESAEGVARRLAVQKALAGRQQISPSQDAWVIAGDTLVVIETPPGAKILGKPSTRDEAFAMLQSLSGITHKVYSSVAVLHQEEVKSAVNCTEVTFGEIDQTSLEAYLDTDEPYDKAGGYAIQGQAAQWISNINGSYYAVVGLPIYELRQLLESFDFFNESYVCTYK